MGRAPAHLFCTRRGRRGTKCPSFLQSPYAPFTSRFNHDVVARPGITKPQDLRGKRFGVQSIGGGMWMRAMLALEHLGLEPERDGIQVLVVGDQTILLQALDTGTIDVATLDKVFTTILKQKGFSVLLDMY